ncbi:MAG: sarcolemmal membrane-associated protein [Acetatifactor sp.]|nr:sarcolemmal membrane-associated protein [Acetatifactor sp.]
MAEYNELTKRLLAEGYTAENHPEEVKVASGQLTDTDKLNNIYGGFEYVRLYADKLVYQTGCGLFVMGKEVIDDMSVFGITHSHENNNPVVRCPFLKVGCEKNYDKELGSILYGGRLCVQCWCECHRTDEVYDYSRSIEYEYKKDEVERQRKYDEFSKSRNGRICERHMSYDERTGEWRFHYAPHRCARLCYHPEFCPVLGKKLSSKRGNVFYDLKKTFTVKMPENAQIGLFDKQTIVEIEKGKRVFSKPCSIDICEAYVKVEIEEILRNYLLNHSYEKLWNPTLEVEVLNVRAEQKESRDLMQDLQDIRDGIAISHESDNIAKSKNDKRERSEKARESRDNRLIKKIKLNGFESLSESDQYSAKKFLGDELIEILEEQRKKEKEKESRLPKQVSLFDLYGDAE